MRALLGLVIIVFSVAAGAVADSYLCIADQATGFKFNKSTKTWKATNFNVSDGKYLVARSKDERYARAVTKVGDKRPIAYCDDDISGDDMNLGCNSPGLFRFRFSPKTMRFSMIYIAGYVGPFGIGGLEGDNTPFIEIGKCSPL